MYLTTRRRRGQSSSSAYLNAKRMEYGNYKEIKYCIFDPTGNITALVETEVRAADRPSVASAIMAAHPEVEQAGFVVFNDSRCADASQGGEAARPAQRAAADAHDAAVSLMMAGGEFCGNATMCAAALYAERRGMPADGAVTVKVSGAEAPLTVQLARQLSDDSAAGVVYAAAVTMPPAIGIEKIGSVARAGSEEGAGGAFGLPLVRLQGIDHIITEPDSGFFGLKDDPAAAESLIRECCGALGSDCLGMMFLDGPEAQAAAQDGQPDAAEMAGSARRMTPLVFVPGADTLFWENSCASGSAAAGIWLAMKAGSPVDVRLHQPAGSLRVESDPATGRTVLHGTARLLTQATYKC